ncbi:MAG: hypothetical protein Q4C97_05520 [Bacillota bacterium]|nr:hypothetical protein [Bacillota bacterium]
MGDISVKFLGDNVLFPNELLDYVLYFNEFKSEMDKLFAIQNERVNKEWYDYPDNEFDEMLIEEGKKVISKLAIKDIYDVTINELVNQNKGYVLFKEITEECFENLKDIAIKAMQDWLEGYEKARTSYNQVTGSGTTLYSNSLLSHITFAVIEEGTVRKQLDKADKEYQSAMERLQRSNASTQDRQKKELLYSKVYPAYTNIIAIFMSELFDKYLSILEKHSVYEYSRTKKYSAEQSNEILQNLDLVEEKEKVLVQAFKKCPYNTNIYLELIKMENFDYDTFMTAKVFAQDNLLYNDLEKYCKLNANKFEDIIVPVKILASFKAVSEKEVLRSVYSSEIKEIEEKYKSIQKSFNDNIVLTQWVKKNIVQDTEQLITMRFSDVQKSIFEVINNIVLPETFQKLMSKELLDITIFGTETDLQIINKNLYADMMSKMEAYIAEAKFRKKVYDEAQNAFQSEILKYADAITNLEKEKKQLGFFSFSKKKELEYFICEKKNELDHYIQYK